MRDQIFNRQKIGLVLLLMVATPYPTSAHSKQETIKSAEKFKLGDEAFRKRRDPRQGLRALAIYKHFYKNNPKDWEAGWRYSMACYYVGERLTQDEESKIQIHTEGKNAGFKSAQISPTCAPCHFWGAINMALYGNVEGVFETVVGLGEVINHLEKSIAIDPTYAYGGAYRLLGMIEQKLPGILGGSNDDAKKYYRLAIENGSDEPLNYIFLARLLENAFNDRENAIKVAKKGLQVPTPTPDRVEAVDAIQDLKNFLKRHPPKTK